MNKLIMTGLLCLGLIATANAQLYTVDLTTLTTNKLTNVARITITNFFTNAVYTTINTNSITKGDPLPTAFTKINNWLPWILTSVRTNGSTASGQVPISTNISPGYFWGTASGVGGSSTMGGVATGPSTNAIFSSAGTNAIKSIAIPVQNGVGYGTTINYGSVIDTTNLSVLNDTYLNAGQLHIYSDVQTDPIQYYTVVATDTNLPYPDLTCLTSSNWFLVELTNETLHATYYLDNIDPSSCLNTSYPHTNGVWYYMGYPTFAIYYIAESNAWYMTAGDYLFSLPGSSPVSDSINYTNVTPGAGPPVGFGTSTNSINVTLGASRYSTNNTIYSFYPRTLVLMSSNGVAINTNTALGNALEVNGNVDSTVGFSINGVPISAGASDVVYPTWLTSSNLTVTGASGIAANYNGTYKDSGRGYLTNIVTGWVLAKRSTVVQDVPNVGTATIGDYILLTNLAGLDITTPSAMYYNNPPAYYSHPLLGTYASAAAGSPTSSLPFISYAADNFSNMVYSICSSFIYRSNTWSLVTITNGMRNGDVITVNSNGQKLVDVWLSNSVPVFKPHW